MRPRFSRKDVGDGRFADLEEFGKPTIPDDSLQGSNGDYFVIPQLVTWMILAILIAESQPIGVLNVFGCSRVFEVCVFVVFFFSIQMVYLATIGAISKKRLGYQAVDVEWLSFPVDAWANNQIPVFVFRWRENSPMMRLSVREYSVDAPDSSTRGDFVGTFIVPHWLPYFLFFELKGFLKCLGGRIGFRHGLSPSVQGLEPLGCLRTQAAQLF